MLQTIILRVLRLYLTQTSSEFDKVKKYLKDGGSMEAVEARYTMSKQVKQILIK
jgi:hypothetical protein